MRWTGHQPDLAAAALGDDVAASTARARAKKIHDAVTNRIKSGVKAWVEVHMTATEPKPGELRAMRSQDGWAYGTFESLEPTGYKFRMKRKDAVGKLTDLGTYCHYLTAEETFPVSWWRVDKRDYFGAGDVEQRLLGPRHRSS